MEEYIEMRDEIEEEIVDKLEALVNPENAVGSSFIAIEGIYEYGDWYRYIGSKIAAISVATMICTDSEPIGNGVYKYILCNIELRLPTLTEDDLMSLDKFESGFSPCIAGTKRKEKAYEILKENDFFGKLDLVYATLEIFTSMFIPDDSSVSMGSAEALKSYYKEEFDNIDGKIKEYEKKMLKSRNMYIDPKKRMELQRNKYRALHENADAGYQHALRLMDGLYIKKIKQAIVDNKIEYIRPI